MEMLLFVNISFEMTCFNINDCIHSLVTTESMEELVNLVTQEPTEEMDEKSRYK